MLAEPLITWSEPARELVGFIGSFLAAGAVGFRYTAARPGAVAVATDPEHSFYAQRLRGAASIGVIGAVIILAGVVNAVPGAAAKHHVGAMTWLTSDTGTALLMVSALLETGGLLLAWVGSRAGWPIAAIGIIGGSFQMAFVGRYTALVNPIHRLAAGLWIGTLFMLFVSGLAPLLRHEELRDRRGPMAADMVNRFSPLALTMGAIVVIFGFITAWRHLPTVNDLWTTPYGYTLIVKLVLVAVVFGLGAFNWRRQRPSLGSESAAVSLRRSSRSELIAAAVVLVVTSILVSLPSPKKPGPPSAAVATPRTRPSPPPK